MHESERSRVIARASLFAELDASVVARLAQSSASRAFDAGETVFAEGDRAESILVMATGLAKVFVRGERAKEISLTLLEPITVIGEIGAFEGTARSASLMALERSEFVSIDRRTFLELFDADRAFARRFATHLVSLVRRTNDQLAWVGTALAHVRVVWCLCRMATERGQPRNGGRVIRPSPTHDQLAETIGCTRETVTRVMSGLRVHGYVIDDAEGLYVASHAHEIVGAFDRLPL